jgi:protein-L-isoaspartate(D-aspartate) O-methyltransferase
VLEALRTVRRASFVPRELRNEVGYDCAIPIGRAQTTSQPSLIGLMIEALELGPEDTVLEIGTGHGYQAALLAKLARRVFSVERISELAQVARLNLSAEGVSNVEVVTGDGTLGLPGFAPFGGIVVAAAFLRVPAPLATQLAPGGKLVMPVGNGGGDLVKVFDCGCCVGPVSCPCSGRTDSRSARALTGPRAEPPVRSVRSCTSKA